MKKPYQVNWWAVRIFADILAFCVGIALFQSFKYHLLLLAIVPCIALFGISAYLIGMAKRHLKFEATK